MRATKLVGQMVAWTVVLKDWHWAGTWVASMAD